MKCYRHHDTDATGLCKSCYKAVCPECSTLVAGSVSCVNSCEEDVAALNYMIERGNKVYKNLDKQWGPSVLINGIGGAFFIGFGIYNYHSSTAWLLIGLGIIMMAGGVMSAMQAKRMSDKKADSSEK